MDRQKGIIRYVVGLCAALTGLAAGGVLPATASANVVPSGTTAPYAAERPVSPAQPTPVPPLAVRAAVDPDPLSDLTVETSPTTGEASLPDAPDLMELGEARAVGALPDPQVYGARIFRGRAFDTCHAPSLATLRAWLASPYRAVGIYYGGRGRHCLDQPRLSRSWALGAQRMGWDLLPVYVGSQSPCVRNKAKWHVRMGSRPWEQGRSEGRDAVRRAKALGMVKRSALYLDMEAYDRKNAKCALATLDFIRGWNREVRSRGYFPGFYSSANSGVRHLETARRAGIRDLPSAMWFARWGKKPSLYGEPTLRDSAWHPHRRIHQYAGNVSEKHGGRRLSIDRNAVDAPVAIVR
ncbi:DUF1906 domain-containing protein [Streptomyces sp. NPDC018031]|uniref:DUF1906 domain-containing protein n=1 Tax=Streptomyces sp. NPDC018031 TaxID=3365033 RepID=UPI0037A6D816